MAKEGLAQFSIPMKFYGTSLSDAQRESVCASLDQNEKSALRLFWIGQGLANLKEVKKMADPELSKELDGTLGKLERKELIYLAKDLNHPGEIYVIVMPQGLQVMGLLFSKRD